MRELVRAARPPPPAATAGGAAGAAAAAARGDCWLERGDWEARLATVEEVFRDRGARYPKKPWHDDEYRRCEYSVDWASGRWEVDDTHCDAKKEKSAGAESACVAQ